MTPKITLWLCLSFAVWALASTAVGPTHVRSDDSKQEKKAAKQEARDAKAAARAEPGDEEGEPEGTDAAANDDTKRVEDPATKNTLTLRVTGIEVSQGKLACALFWQNKGFPRKHRRALRRTWVEAEDAEDGTALCVFKRTGLGEYAASVFLDTNGNGKLDTNAIGSPSEPWGVSNDAKAKRFGPPIFKDAKFDYEGGPVTIEIALIND